MIFLNITVAYEVIIFENFYGNIGLVDVTKKNCRFIVGKKEKKSEKVDRSRLGSR